MKRLSSFFMQFHMQTLSSRSHYIGGTVSLFVISLFHLVYVRSVGETGAFRSGCRDGGPSFFVIAAAQRKNRNWD